MFCYIECVHAHFGFCWSWRGCMFLVLLVWLCVSNSWYHLHRGVQPLRGAVSHRRQRRTRRHLPARHWGISTFPIMHHSHCVLAMSISAALLTFTFSTVALCTLPSVYTGTSCPSNTHKAQAQYWRVNLEWLTVARWFELAHKLYIVLDIDVLI